MPQNEPMMSRAEAAEVYYREQRKPLPGVRIGSAIVDHEALAARLQSMQQERDAFQQSAEAMTQMMERQQDRANDAESVLARTQYGRDAAETALVELVDEIGTGIISDVEGGLPFNMCISCKVKVHYSWPSRKDSKDWQEPPIPHTPACAWKAAESLVAEIKGREGEG